MMGIGLIVVIIVIIVVVIGLGKKANDTFLKKKDEENN